MSNELEPRAPSWLALKRDDLTVMSQKFDRENHRPKQWMTFLGGLGALGAGAALMSVSPLFLIGGWAGAFACFGVALARERRLRAEYDVKCPSCNASLLKKGTTELAVATGNCPFCGARLFE